MSTTIYLTSAGVVLCEQHAEPLKVGYQREYLLAATSCRADSTPEQECLLCNPPYTCPADCDERCCDARVDSTADCGCTANRYHDRLSLCADHQRECDEQGELAARIADEEAFGYYRSDDA